MAVATRPAEEPGRQRVFLAGDDREGERVDLQAEVDIIGMNTLVSASPPSATQVGGCSGGPRAVEIRDHLDIASGEMPTDTLSAGQVLSGLACVAGDDERHRPGTIGLQEPRL